MLKNIIPSEWKTDVYYELVFDDGHNNGYGFPCDKSGNLFDMQDCARENLEWAKAHPEKFKRFGVVVTYKNRYREPAHGTCSCGREVVLEDIYCGACECECGRWYNLYGQELLAPEFWEEDTGDDEWF